MPYDITNESLILFARSWRTGDGRAAAAAARNRWHAAREEEDTSSATGCGAGKQVRAPCCWLLSFLYLVAALCRRRS